MLEFVKLPQKMEQLKDLTFSGGIQLLHRLRFRQAGGARGGGSATDPGGGANPNDFQLVPLSMAPKAQDKLAMAANRNSTTNDNEGVMPSTTEACVHNAGVHLDEGAGGVQRCRHEGKAHSSAFCRHICKKKGICKRPFSEPSVTSSRAGYSCADAGPDA